MTSVPSVSDAVAQIGKIESQIQQLQSGAMLNSLLGVSSGTSGSSGASNSSFSSALAAAQGDSTTSDAASATTLETGYDTTTGTTAAEASGGVALPAKGASMLTSDQRQFASTLSASTGLNPGVVCAWLLAEESGGAAQSRQAQNNNDWLNIGYTGSGTYGAGDSIWSDPVKAANATAAWIKGQDSIPGYGTASSGIQGILNTVGETPSQQISALQNSGWAGSGYTTLGTLYAEVTGS